MSCGRGTIPPHCPTSPIRAVLWEIGWGGEGGAYLHDQLKSFSLLQFLHQVPGNRERERNHKWRRKSRDTETEETLRMSQDTLRTGNMGGAGQWVGAGLDQTEPQGRGIWTAPTPTRQGQRPG